MSYIKIWFPCLVFLYCIQNGRADDGSMEVWLLPTFQPSNLPIFQSSNLPTFQHSDSIPDDLPEDSIKINKKENKKFIAAILAFPVPFGILGLHRIYLGTKPYIPFVYLGTIGGCIGILPLIDFITILSADKEAFKCFENNPGVFLWSH